MTIKEILFGSGGVLLILMTLIQITPVKLNPWSAVIGWVGKHLNQTICDKIETLEEDITVLKKDICTIRDENREIHAKDCRVRILRFADEIYIGTNHSHEHYKQVLGDITHYEKYCAEHPSFENQIAVSAIRHIKETYDTHIRKHDFLN